MHSALSENPPRAHSWSVLTGGVAEFAGAPLAVASADGLVVLLTIMIAGKRQIRALS